MPDPVDALIAAWVNWEAQPGSLQAVEAKHDALHALDLPANAAHDHIATWRRNGYSIPDAVQTLINTHEHQEAA